MIQIRMRLRTWLAVVAFLAVFFSIVSREAKQARGWIRPGDILIVEVLEGLPGHPITGPRQVCSDGFIDLGHYGRISVSDLTLDEIKNILIHHLRPQLGDELLGLTLTQEDESKSDSKARTIKPVDSNRVFVDFDEKCWRPSPICSEGFLERVNAMSGYRSVSRPRTAFYCCPISKSEPPSIFEKARSLVANSWDWVVSSLAWTIRILSVPIGLCLLSTLEISRKKSNR